MTKNKFLNFVGDTRNYKFHPPLPNPSNMRGNPDIFTWGMNRGGDGINGTPDYNSFDGQYDINNFYNQDGEGDDISEEGTSGGGFISGLGNIFKRNPNKMMDVGGSQYSWETIQGDPNLLNAYQTQKSSNRKNWWANAGNTFGSLTDGFSSAYQGSMTGRNPLTQGPVAGPYNVPPPQTTAPTQSGLGGTTQMIGWVLVGGAVIGLIVYAMTSKGQPQTIVVQQPSAKPLKSVPLGE